MKKELNNKELSKVTGGSPMSPNVSGVIGSAVAPEVLQDMYCNCSNHDEKTGKKDSK